MTTTLLIAGLLQAAAPAAAIPPPAALVAAVAPVPPSPAARPRPAQLFIAPSGEPFRAQAGEPYPVAAWFARADADHDGQLTRGEFRRDAMLFFPKLDSNGDGVVDGKEIERYEQELVPEVRVDFGGGGLAYNAPTLAYGDQADPASRRSGGDDSSADAAPRVAKVLPELPRGAGRYALINAPEPVIAADADLNRRITPGEMAAAADRRFTLLDPDGVGYLTLATLPKTPVQQRGEARLKRR